VILCLGGSQGSLQVNQLVEALRPVLPERLLSYTRPARNSSTPFLSPAGRFVSRPAYIGEEMRICWPPPPW
jgi:hypothetical protein